MTGCAIHLAQEAGAPREPGCLGRGCEPVMGGRERTPSRGRRPERGTCGGLGNGSWGSWGDSREKARDGGAWGFGVSAGLRRLEL